MEGAKNTFSHFAKNIMKNTNLVPGNLRIISIVIYFKTLHYVGCKNLLEMKNEKRC